MSEIWKDVVGFEEFYQVSNIGRVKSKRKNIIMKIGDNGRGYSNIKLQKDGKQHTLYVHRMVAMAFIPNTSDCKEINHINEDKKDNRVENLEWCDRKYNNNYGKVHSSKFKRVINYDTGQVYDGMQIAAKETGVPYHIIHICCKTGKPFTYRQSGKSFFWGYYYEQELG